jgi:hypothetical protein
LSRPGCTIREGDALADCRAETEPGSNEIRLIGKLRSDGPKPEMLGLPRERVFVLPMDRRVATALYVGLGTALGIMTV